MTEFSDAQKLAEIRTQLLLLRRSYPGMIKRGVVSPHEAAVRLRLWEAIEADYSERAQPAFVAA
jgi:hypothetical protein